MSITIEYRDAPAWLQDLQRRHDMRTYVTVEVGLEHHIGGSWHDANRTTLYAYDAAGGRLTSQAGTYGGMNPWASDRENAVNAGTTQTLRSPDHYVAELTSYPKTCTLYVHPDAIARLLPAPADVLDVEHRAVLVAIRSLMARRDDDGLPIRFKECRAFLQPGTLARFEAVKVELIAGGYLNRSGAITAKGRNAVGQAQMWNLRHE